MGCTFSWSGWVSWADRQLLLALSDMVSYDLHLTKPLKNLKNHHKISLKLRVLVLVRYFYIKRLLIFFFFLYNLFWLHFYTFIKYILYCAEFMKIIGCFCVDFESLSRFWESLHRLALPCQQTCTWSEPQLLRLPFSFNTWDSGIASLRDTLFHTLFHHICLC